MDTDEVYNIGVQELTKSYLEEKIYKYAIHKGKTFHGDFNMPKEAGTERRFLVFTNDGYVYVCSYELNGFFREIYEGYKVKPDNVFAWRLLETPEEWYPRKENEDE